MSWLLCGSVPPAVRLGRVFLLLGLSPSINSDLVQMTWGGWVVARRPSLALTRAIPIRHVTAETSDQQCTRPGRQLADALNAEPVQGTELVGGNPQTADRQGFDGIHGPSRRHDTAGPIASHSPGRPRDIGDSRFGSDALPRQTAGQIREQFLLAAEEMRDARDIDLKPVGWIGHHGRVADGPTCEFPQRGLVLVRRGRAHMHACFLRGRTGYADDAARSDRVDGN